MDYKRAKILRKNSTDAERFLWRKLRETMPDFKFRRQQPIGKYIVDFVSFKKNLIIELDGSQHMNTKEYDENRTRWLESQGFRMIRFWDNDALKRCDSVLQSIWENI